MFTDVSYATSQDIKNMLGHLAYVLEGVKRIYNIPSYHMKITYDDQQVKEGRFMFGMVSNSKSIGGLKNIIFPDVVFDDGEFEVILIRKPSNPFEIQELIGCLLSQQYNSTYMESFKASRLMFECEEEVAWTLDGEYGGEHEIVEVKNMKKAITIMVEKSE